MTHIETSRYIRMLRESDVSPPASSVWAAFESTAAPTQWQLSPIDPVTKRQIHNHRPTNAPMKEAMISHVGVIVINVIGRRSLRPESTRREVTLRVIN